MNGIVYARGLAQGTDCPDTPFSVVAPSNDPANRALFSRALLRWTATWTQYDDFARSGTLTKDVARHAHFAVEVLTTVRANVAAGVCCALVAVDPDENILGAMTYFVIPPHEATIGLLVVEPRNIPGSPTVVQYRGVGTTMVAAAAQRMVAAAVHAIFLHPLDPEARRFWIARGFVPSAPATPNLLVARGEDRIKALVDHCLLFPDNPAGHELLLCGLPKQVRERLLSGVSR